MMTKERKLATDIHDEIRAQFDKIAKLVPDIEDWQHVQAVALTEAEQTGEPAKNVTQDHHVAAARAILNATKTMGTAVRVLNRYCVEVEHVHEQHSHDALDKFFAPERANE
jgi:hypothetical protein